MRRPPTLRLLSIVGILASIACEGGVGPITTPPITRASDFEATVAVVARETVVSPAGQRSQIDVWVVIQPGTSANAAVIVSDATPVFLQRGSESAVVAARADALVTGDHVKVWHDANTSFGAAEAPPGSPAYSAVQLIIVR